jgi:hypothetical protein
MWYKGSDHEDLIKHAAAAKHPNDAKLEEFSKWILNVGDGKLSKPNDEYADVDFPSDLLITNFGDCSKHVSRLSQELQGSKKFTIEGYFGWNTGYC